MGLVKSLEPAVTVTAPAKINLYLHVVGRRLNGFHELDSLVVFSDFGDQITATAAEGLSLTVDGPYAAALAGDAADNLVLRAAKALVQVARAPGGAHLRLTKNLPIASGIGGGSSDAAATLKALLRLWDVTLPTERLMEIAAGLGSDVPVCMLAGPAWLGGVGEAVERAPPLPPLGILVVNPNIALSTPAVFKARQGPFSAPARFAGTPKDAAALIELLGLRRNDLAAPAIGLVPEIAEILGCLEESAGCLLARMSGSGATCFALFPTPLAAESTAVLLAAKNPGWWVQAGGLLGAG